MKRMVTFLVLTGALAFVSYAVAQDGDKTADAAKTCPATSADGAVCPASKLAQGEDGEKAGCCAASEEALAQLPKMTYVIGDKKTCCADSAAALAKKSDKPMQFIVGDKTFKDKAVAFTALVESTESFVSEFAKPQTCEKSGAVSVAGKECGCSHEVSAIERLVKTTMDDVKMTYVVGDKKCECPNEAKALAAEAGQKTEYVVNGEKTGCNMTARLNLVRAKYLAVVNAIAKKENEKGTEGASPHGT